MFGLTRENWQLILDLYHQSSYDRVQWLKIQNMMPEIVFANGYKTKDYHRIVSSEQIARMLDRFDLDPRIKTAAPYNDMLLYYRENGVDVEPLYRQYPETIQSIIYQLNLANISYDTLQLKNNLGGLYIKSIDIPENYFIISSIYRQVFDDNDTFLTVLPYNAITGEELTIDYVKLFKEYRDWALEYFSTNDLPILDKMNDYPELEEEMMELMQLRA